MPKYDEAVIRVSGSYGLKTPGAVEYTSEDFHASISIEVPSSGEMEQIEEEIFDLYSRLATNAKLAVFTQAGVEYEETADGVLAPKASSLQAMKAAQGGGRTAPAAAPAPQAQAPRPQQQQGAGNYGPPKAGGRLAEMPRYPVSLPDGTAAILIDQRPLKQDGTYKPGAADFKVDAKGGASFWVGKKDGSPNTDTVQWLASQGIEV